MNKGMLARRAVAVIAVAASLALAPLALPASANASPVRVYVSVLKGANEIGPAGGDAEGVALAAATLNDNGQLCYLLAEKNLAGTVTLAHIHRGAAGANGPVVVPLEAPVDGTSHACIDIAPALATEINDNPRGFYWNIHTTVFPAGAIRAQLR